MSKTLAILYRDDLSALRDRTLCPSLAKRRNIKIITPTKRELIHAMMMERLKEVDDIEEKITRSSQQYINKTISKALHYEKNSN